MKIVNHPATQPCAAVGCQHAVRRGLLMCMDHWRMVPAARQRDVWDWYRKIGRQPDARQRYEAAVQAAVDAVHQKALARKASKDAQTPPLF